MSYRISSKITLEKLEDYITSAGAALHASKQTRDLAPEWFALLEEADKAAADRKQSHRKTTIARAVVRVADVEWDSTIEKVSDEAWLLSEKDRKKPPYEPLFGKLTASRVKKFGMQKAVAFGEDFVKRLEAQEHPKLLPFVGDVRQANEGLKAAEANRKEASREERMHDFPRLGLVDRTQALVNKTEIALLSRFPGNRELVRAILSPTSATRRRRRAAAEQTAQTPSVPTMPVPTPLPDEIQPPRPAPVPPTEDVRTTSPAESSVQPAELAASPYRTDVEDDDDVIIE